MTDGVLELSTDLAGLVLRELTEADVDSYYAVLDRNRDHFRRYGDYQDEIDATRAWVAQYFASPPDRNVRLGIWRDGQLIGRVDLNPVSPPHYSIGYWLSGDSTGHGYATRACRAAISYCRDVLGGTDLLAGVTHGNVNSVAVLLRLGFAKVAEFDGYDRYQLSLGDSR